MFELWSEWTGYRNNIYVDTFYLQEKLVFSFISIFLIYKMLISLNQSHEKYIHTSITFVSIFFSIIIPTFPPQSPLDSEIQISLKAVASRRNCAQCPLAAV